MCFSIPYKIIAIENDYAVLEDGRKIFISKDEMPHVGDFVQLAGNMINMILSQKDGEAIRSVIARLNT